MSSGHRQYNAEDGVRWERYADAFRAWLDKRGRYPGTPPAGYLEVFKVSQRFAPCPHEYPELVAAATRPAAPPVPPSMPGVTMTADAFSALLAHNSAVHSQIADLAQRPIPAAPALFPMPATRMRPSDGWRRGRGGRFQRARVRSTSAPLTGMSYEPFSPEYAPHATSDRLGGPPVPQTGRARRPRRRGRRGGRARTPRTQHDGQHSRVDDDTTSVADTAAEPRDFREYSTWEYIDLLVDRMAALYNALDESEVVADDVAEQEEAGPSGTTHCGSDDEGTAEDEMAVDEEEEIEEDGDPEERLRF
ncbi:hypothetical protein OH76DRAFT_1423648 [Lentinus brumalis]|uniref:Uncharacterized protein n=1 Tax=Lentinus brumalis TaxID=2498619 RepID=A0A371CHY4_9APHY|nr:hypothetical protein OH76DRAFT_1424027 [Polyporus brumalis]RDX40506.1 hypothetical protein OH76DRAFT_1423648 [Polyporus brumalis]